MDSNVRRAFLQCIIARRSLTESEAKGILLDLVALETPEEAQGSQDQTDPSVREYVDACNASLVDFELEIKTTRDQETGATVLTFVNLHSTPSTMPATLLSSTDILFMRNIIDQIYGKNQEGGEPNSRFYVTAAEATTDVYPKDRKDRPILGRTQVIEKLNTLVDLGWLLKHSAGEDQYALSNRALSELGQYIFDNYESAARCAMCKELFRVGYACTCGNTFIHPSCKTSYIDYKGETCSACGTSMDGMQRVTF